MSLRTVAVLVCSLTAALGSAATASAASWNAFTDFREQGEPAGAGATSRAETSRRASTGVFRAGGRTRCCRTGTRVPRHTGARGLARRGDRRGARGDPPLRRTQHDGPADQPQQRDLGRADDPAPPLDGPPVDRPLEEPGDRPGGRARRVQQLRPGGGDGIDWSIDSGLSNHDSGVATAGSRGRNLALNVTAGQIVDFSVGPGSASDTLFDTTRLNLTITEPRAAKLVTNGSFETPDQETGSRHSLTLGPRWVDVAGRRRPARPALGGGHGAQSLDLLGTRYRRRDPDLATTAGTAYTLRYQLAATAEECGGSNRHTVEVRWDGAEIDRPTINTTGDSNTDMGYLARTVNIPGGQTTSTSTCSSSPVRPTRPRTRPAGR